jgi:hypothetical protein
MLRSVIFSVQTSKSRVGMLASRSSSVTATTRLDQQLSHPLHRLVIFDVFRQPGVSTCFATSFRSSLTQRVSDALVHAARCFSECGLCGTGSAASDLGVKRNLSFTPKIGGRDSRRIPDGVVLPVIAR